MIVNQRTKNKDEPTKEQRSVNNATIGMILLMIEASYFITNAIVWMFRRNEHAIL